jgi:hypothetical protein
MAALRKIPPKDIRNFSKQQIFISELLTAYDHNQEDTLNTL